jgi:hypothetical protein
MIQLQERNTFLSRFKRIEFARGKYAITVANEYIK